MQRCTRTHFYDVRLRNVLAKHTSAQHSEFSNMPNRAAVLSYRSYRVTDMLARNFREAGNSEKMEARRVLTEVPEDEFNS